MNKAIIYLRDSTKEQNPELQLKECSDFCKKNNLEVLEVVKEYGSAYNKKKVRPDWEKVQKKSKDKKVHIVLWRYDRAFRNRKEFYKFMKVMFEVYNLKVYSVKEPSILSFWNMIDNTKSENPIFDELIKGILRTLWDFMIQQAGEEAEEESKKKGERVKLAVRKNKKGKTISYNGKIWGRKGLSEKTIKEVLDLKSSGMSIREIAQSVFYWDKNNNRKELSKSSVHKILQESLKENGGNNQSSK